jgi:RNA polymerase sigma-70 factor (ECF subfamily)
MNAQCHQAGACATASERRGAVSSDEALIERIASGDQNAMRTLVGRHYTRVYRFVMRFVKDSDAARDVVNDTFLAVWQQADRFEGRSQAATWFLGIARYRALTQYKLRPAPTESLDEQNEATLVDPGERPDAGIQREDSRRYMKRCLAALPREQALLIELHYYREKSLEEAASIVGIPVNTVKTRLFLARKKLAAMVAAEDRGLAATAARRPYRPRLHGLAARPAR